MSGEKTRTLDALP